MIDFITFGRPPELTIHGRPCYESFVTKHDAPWRSGQWRSQFSSMYRWKKTKTGVFEFSTCLEKSDGRYTIVDWHSVMPEMSLFYLTVKDDVIEVRFDKQLVFSKPIIDDEWIDWKAEIRFSPTGHINLWCNGELVVNQDGRTLYKDGDESYFQIGCYQFDPWITDHRRMYFQI